MVACALSLQGKLRNKHCLPKKNDIVITGSGQPCLIGWVWAIAIPK